MRKLPKNAIAGINGDTFTVEDEHGSLVASEEPAMASTELIEKVRELLAHIDDLAAEFDICREISRSSYSSAVQSALTALGGVA